MIHLEIARDVVKEDIVAIPNLNHVIVHDHRIDTHVYGYMVIMSYSCAL